MNILDRIVSVKREEIKNRKLTNPSAKLEKSLFFDRVMPSFRQALSAPGPSVICEFKRRSPSGGDINRDAGLNQVVLGYQDAGAAAVSVLTDNAFFGGNSSDLLEAASILSIPVLRKDFIIDEYQVLESKALGASAILLIGAILSKNEIDLLSGRAASLGLDILYEIHDQADLERMSRNIKIIGVNNRNLKTLGVSIGNSRDLFKFIPPDCLKVAESGIQSRENVRDLFMTGYDAFLVGEKFMRSADPGRSAAIFIDNLKSVAR